jgi:hypothetical protein
MPVGIIFVFISTVLLIFIITGVHSFMGVRYIGNVFGASGISEGAYAGLWLFVLGGYGLGAWLIASDVRSKNNKRTVTCDTNSEMDTYSTESFDTKKCPKCAETIKSEAIACKHCKYEYSKEELQLEGKEKERRKKILEYDEYAFTKLEEETLLQLAYDYQHNRKNYSKAKFYLQRMFREYPNGEYMKVGQARLKEMGETSGLAAPDSSAVKSKFCAGCGTKVDADSAFCQECGKPVS